METRLRQDQITAFQEVICSFAVHFRDETQLTRLAHQELLPLEPLTDPAHHFCGIFILQMTFVHFTDEELIPKRKNSTLPKVT